MVSGIGMHEGDKDDVMDAVDEQNRNCGILVQEAVKARRCRRPAM